jgi:hypothetical protein
MRRSWLKGEVRRSVSTYCTQASCESWVDALCNYTNILRSSKHCLIPNYHRNMQITNCILFSYWALVFTGFIARSMYVGCIPLVRLISQPVSHQLAYNNWSVADQLKFICDILRGGEESSFSKFDIWLITLPRDLLYLI